MSSFWNEAEIKEEEEEEINVISGPLITHLLLSFTICFASTDKEINENGFYLIINKNKIVNLSFLLLSFVFCSLLRSW